MTTQTTDWGLHRSGLDVVRWLADTKRQIRTERVAMGRLSKPVLPDGPRRTLSDALHELHRRAGWPAVRDLERALGGSGVASRSRIHDAFTQSRLPNWGLVEVLVLELARRVPRLDAESELVRFHELWNNAAAGSELPAEANLPSTTRAPAIREMARESEGSDRVGLFIDLNNVMAAVPSLRPVHVGASLVRFAQAFGPLLCSLIAVKPAAIPNWQSVHKGLLQSGFLVEQTGTPGKASAGDHADALLAVRINDEVRNKDLTLVVVATADLDFYGLICRYVEAGIHVRLVSPNANSIARPFLELAENQAHIPSGQVPAFEVSYLDEVLSADELIEEPEVPSRFSIPSSVNFQQPVPNSVTLPGGGHQLTAAHSGARLGPALQRFLFVGVGGSGGRTLRYVYRELSARLRQVGIHTMPTGWQFLHIDADAPLVSEESPDLPALPPSAYTALVTPHLTYSVVFKTLQQSTRTPDADYAGWLPQPLNASPQHGAGQFRAIGRALTLHRYDRIREDLKRLVHRLESSDAVSSLIRVNAAIRGGQARPDETRNPVVVVVSSLSGGTGSGAFLDVCDILRSLDQLWAGDSTALLYSPDVFQGLGRDKTASQANALAAVSELLAGHWNTLHEGTAATGTIPGRVDGPAQRGPARSLIVGSGNGVLMLDEQTQVFEAVGRTLAAWATSPAIQQHFRAYMWGSWQQEATGKDPLGLMEGELEAPFSSLGHSSVSLGRDLFHRYVAQCLGRLAAERLLYGAAGGSTANPAHADRDTQVQRAWPPFLRAVRLDSPGAVTGGALLDQLAPPRETTVLTDCESIRQRLGDAMQPLSWWAEGLRTQIGERRPLVLAEHRQQLMERARQWVPEIERVVLEEVERVLLNDSLPVAIGLVETLVRQLDDELVPRLEAEALNDFAEADRFTGEIDQALGEEASRFIRRRPKMLPANHQRVEAALMAGAEAAFGRARDAQARQMVAALLRDLSRHLLVPLTDALHHALETLLRETGMGAYANWPASPAFIAPSALQPSRTQFLIDPVDGYPTQMMSLLHSMAIGGEDPSQHALKQVLLGAGPLDRVVDGTAVPRALVSLRRGWQPDLARSWSQSADVEHTAVIDVSTTAEELLLRAMRWCGDVQHALGRFIHQSLQEALGGESPPPAALERLTRFEAAFTAAMRSSAPLVRLDPAYAALILDYDARSPQPFITAIPLTEGTEAYRAAVRVLTKAGASTEAAAVQQFDPAGPAQIEMVTFLDRPHHHVAFQSLTRPILENWESLRHSGRLSMFSRWCRARSLPNAVPLSQDARQSLVRGYFVAVADDAINVAQDGRRITIRLDDDSTVAFPDPLLGPAVEADDPFDCLGGLVESLQVALVAATYDDGPLRAYQRLIVLGRARRGAVMATTQSRLAALKELKDTAAVLYPLDGASTAKRGWELRRDIHAALDHLIRDSS